MYCTIGKYYYIYIYIYIYIHTYIYVFKLFAMMHINVVHYKVIYVYTCQAHSRLHLFLWIKQYSKSKVNTCNYIGIQEGYVGEYSLFAAFMSCVVSVAPVAAALLRIETGIIKFRSMTIRHPPLAVCYY